jgi:hypothetical protein
VAAIGGEAAETVSAGAALERGTNAAAWRPSQGAGGAWLSQRTRGLRRGALPESGVHDGEMQVRRILASRSAPSRQGRIPVFEVAVGERIAAMLRGRA